MNPLDKELDEFLLSISMHPEQTNVGETSELMLAEMDRGLRGLSSTLPMIPTYISADAAARQGEPVIVIDVGGTNLRTGLCVFESGAPRTYNVEISPIPGSGAAVTADEFFTVIAEKILPLTSESDKIGFCFSYPAEVFPDRDGRILQLGKEISVTGADGAVIGRELKSKLAELGAGGDFTFSLLNDTTAGLMGGVAALGLGPEGGLAGLVVGTGVNACYYERGENIHKVKNATDMIINCEMGMFGKALRGRADYMLDESSEIPGDHLLEKMVSGAYLGRVISNCCALAAARGLMSPAFEQLEAPFYLPELDDFLRGASGRIDAMCTPRDKAALLHITDRMFERSARLICSVIRALVLHTGGGTTADKPFQVAAEGSTLNNSLLLESKLNALVEDRIERELHRYVRFLRADSSTLAGAALSVFTIGG